MRTTQKSKKYFIGLPIPAAACVLSSLVLLSSYTDQPLVTRFFPALSLALMYLLSFLMISRVRYSSFKDVEMIKAHPYTVSVSIVLLFVLIASEPKLFAFIFFMAYLFSGLVYTFFVFPIRHGTFLRGLFRQRSS
jgi:CDP-diacylglycerol--serine O-phosphatidyltransferase